MEIALPSSPVWYQTKSSDTSSDGYFAFASRSFINLLDIKQDTPQYFGILSGHEDRVTSCSFCQKKPFDECLYLASGGDDCSVKVWDVMTKSIINDHNAHGVGKISALHWSPLSEHIIASGDERGCLIVWNLEKGATSKYVPDAGHQQIACIVFSPHYSNLIAVGYKSGAISIIDLARKGAIFRKFRGHGNEVQSIVWSFYPREDVFHKNVSDDMVPVKPVASNCDELLKGIVISGSKDRTIRVWGLTKGKCQKILKLPAKASKGKRQNEDFSRLFISLYWPQDSESVFVSSSYNGDILLWDLSKNDKENYQVLSSQCPDANHQRIVFSINAGSDPRNSIITTSMDRQIKFWTLTHPQSPPVCSLPTLGGYVYCLAISSLDPSVVAMGVGDGIIRIWKTKNPRNIFDVTMLWQGVKEKVMSLSWHPKREGILGFGTEDGKIGLYDVLSQRPPIISTTYHLKPVYAMSWGPHCYVTEPKDNDIQLSLFTCGGEGVILMHPPNLKEDSVDVSNIVSATNPDHVICRRSEVMWRSDEKVVAMGNDNGSFDIYSSPHLLLLVTVKVHNKIINCLRWCPADVDDDAYYWIASGANNCNICVTDLKKFLHHLHNEVSNEEDLHKEGPPYSPHQITEPHRTLSGHNGRITGLSWNNNDYSQIVSSSYDGTVQVWNVVRGEGVSNYRGHDGRCLCVSWSPVIDNGAGSGVIYSGADDYSAHVWRLEAQDNSLPPQDVQHVSYNQKHTSQWKRKNKKKKQSSSVNRDKLPKCDETVITSSHNENDSNVNIEDLLEKKKRELISDFELTINNHDLLDKDEEEPSSSPSELDPDKHPGDLASGDGIKDILDELSQSRKVAMETKDEDGGRGSRRKRLKNLFPLSTALDNRKREGQQEDCIDIANMEDLSDLVAERPNLGFYGNRKSAYRMLRKEDEQLCELGQFEGSYILKMWKGDVIGAIESAIERNDLTDQLVALAPVAGYDVWQHACSAFAEQLSKEGLHLHATHYLLACNKVRDAILLLRNNKHYREAVAMARARLPDNDELLIETVTTWGHRLKTGGSLEMAAKCFASIGDYITAADCLAERASSKTSSLTSDDLRSLFAAAAMARSARLTGPAEHAKRAVVNVATLSGRWKEAQIVCAQFGADLMEYRLVLCVHELLSLLISSSTSDPAFSLSNIFTHHVLTEWAGQFHSSGSTFAQKVLEIWNERFLDKSSDTESLRSSVEAMTSTLRGLTYKQSIYQISLHLTCALLCCYPPGHATSLCRHHVDVCSSLNELDQNVTLLLSDVYQSVFALLPTSTTTTDVIPSDVPTSPHQETGFDDVRTVSSKSFECGEITLPL